MARIADGEGSVIEFFPSSAQTSQFAYVGKSFTDGFITDREFLAQYMKCSQDCLLVALLIGTLELHIYIAGFAAFQTGYIKVLGEKNRCILRLRLVLEYGSGLREVFSNDYRNARLDDSSLFTGNLGKGVAQELGVVEADVGDDGKDWGDDVGAVESSAQSHFDDRIIHLLLCKVFQCHGCSEFEEGWMKWFEESPVLFYEVNDILLRNAFSVHSDTFSEIYQMGRGVESYLVTLALKNGSKGMGAGSFAVGSSYVDGLVFLMRVTEVIIQGECGLQAWLVSLRSDFLKDRSTVEEVFCCFLIIHFLYI